MVIKDFHNVRFPENISYGSSGGPGFKTTILELSSGHEQRNIDWSLALARYDAAHGIKERYQMEEILEFFYARRGKAFGFRFKDWMDYVLPRQAIGVVGTSGAIELQTYKRYEADTDYYYDRPLVKLVPDTVELWINDVAANVAFVDTETGLVTAPTGGGRIAGQVVEIACEFDVPVRFDTDEINVTHDDWELMSWPSIPLRELKPRAS